MPSFIGFRGNSLSYTKVLLFLHVLELNEHAWTRHETCDTWEEWLRHREKSSLGVYQVPWYVSSPSKSTSVAPWQALLPSHLSYFYSWGASRQHRQEFCLEKSLENYHGTIFLFLNWAHAKVIIFFQVCYHSNSLSLWNNGSGNWGCQERYTLFSLPRCGTGAAGWRNPFENHSHFPDTLGKVSQKGLLNIPTEVINL